MISVILPTFNERKNPYFKKILERFKDVDQLIIADSNSSDETVKIAAQYTKDIYNCDINSRSERINLGIEKAKNDIIIIHHPRSLLAKDAEKELLSISDAVQWGAFTHKFDIKHFLLRFTSWYSNQIRGDKKNIYYLDHCIFLRKEIVKNVFPIPTMDIFEDTEICLRLAKYNNKRLKTISTTSAIRFTKNGILKQCLTNLYLKYKYKKDSNLEQMNKLYEKNTRLNNNYDDN